MKYNNIYKKRNRYYIQKTIYNQKIEYGSFSRLDDAIKQRDKLIKYDWIKCKTTGYPKREHFPKYHIRKDEEEKYIIINKKRGGMIYGSYKSYKYAKLVKKILPYYTTKVDIKLIEKQAVKEFYKYISYNNINNRYYIYYKGYVLGTYANLVTALQERDLIVKYDGNEELMCEDPTSIYTYDKSKLPPFPKKIENIVYENTYKNKYRVRKQIRNNTITIGRYPTYNLAVLIRDYLAKNGWNEKTIKHVTKVTETIQKRNKNIHKRNGKYYVETMKNGKIRIYACYDNLELARYVKQNLKEDNWKKKNITKYEENYYHLGYKPLYYYDDTDFLKEES